MFFETFRHTGDEAALAGDQLAPVEAHRPDCDIMRRRE